MPPGVLGLLASGAGASHFHIHPAVGLQAGNQLAGGLGAMAILRPGERGRLTHAPRHDLLRRQAAVRTSQALTAWARCSERVML